MSGRVLRRQKTRIANPYALSGSRHGHRQDRNDYSVQDKRRMLEKTVTSISLTNRIRSANSKSDKKKSSSILNLFRILGHTGFLNRVLLLLGCIVALLNGLCWPVLNYFTAEFAEKLSRLLTSQTNLDKLLMAQPSACGSSNASTLDCDSANNSALCGNVTTTPTGCLTKNLAGGFNLSDVSIPDANEFLAQVYDFVIPMVSVAVSQIVTAYVSILILNFTAERIIFQVRKLFLKALLRQDSEWFDSRQQGELTGNHLRNMGLIQTALGEKLGTLLICLSEVTSSLAICLYSGWKLTLVMAVLYPVLIIAAKINIKFQQKMHKLLRVVNAEVAGVVQEVLSSLRTVIAFGGEEKEMARFQQRLRISRRMNSKQVIASVMNSSFIFVITQCFISLGFWYGIKLHVEAKVPGTAFDYLEYDVKEVLMINVMILMSGVFIRQAVPLLEVINIGLSAATDIIAIIDKEPNIDSSSREGIKLESIKGCIEFKNVHFFYPTDPNKKKVLRGLNLKINEGETVALVGPSGGGKSTVLQLVQRFYDPHKGDILIDGQRLKELNLGTYLESVGIVNQEPTLFNISVRENIGFGKDNASEEDIVRAAKEANAHDFISKLETNYDTMVGEQGSQLSGGQKQRIVIARALVRNPRILLLDEATSALDNESEAIVQESLEHARTGRTTLIVAHRLTTIRTADRIVAIKDGRVVEEGTHDELLDKEGIYYQLLQEQIGEGDSQLDTMPTDDEILMMEDSDEEEESDDDEDFAEQILKITDEDDKSADDEIEKAEIRKAFWKILWYSRHDWPYIVCCLLFYVVFAASHPARALVYGLITETVVVEQLQHTDYPTLFPILYVVVGFTSFVIAAIRGWAQVKSEEGFLFAIRHKIFGAIMKQEMGWFDDPARNMGSLISLVTTDAENVKKIPCAMLGTWLYATAAISAIMIISMVLSWKVCLVTASVSAFIFICNYFQGKVAQGAMLGVIKSEERANNVAIEIIRNVKTVMSLHIQQVVFGRYCKELDEPRSIVDRSGQLRAIIAALSEGFMFFGYTVCLSYSSTLIYKQEIEFREYATILSLMIVNLMEVTHALAAVPSSTKAGISARRILALINRKPLVDSDDSAGLVMPHQRESKIEFHDVRFSYPTRPSTEILKGFQLTIESRTTVALVGRSGCGKSTGIQLLQRFYDSVSGSVALNGYDIRCLNIKSLRSMLGVVSQEPVLFSRTIAENIAYGNNTRHVCMHEVIDAARKANIHEFITALPQAYETRVGPGGVQLSGGQKQRIAIARALLRDPQILLLDEATSALDNESEKIVQDALDKARQGRTCIVIAHRLSTVQNADLIVVVEQGQVVEQGTHDELMDKRGVYFQHLQIQQGQRKRLSRIVL